VFPPSTEEKQPDRKREKRSQTDIDKDRPRKLLFEIQVYKENPYCDGQQYANNSTKNPGGEK
jgi:hypothetical protein